jgi:hypothetical protein
MAVSSQTFFVYIVIFQYSRWGTLYIIDVSTNTIIKIRINKNQLSSKINDHGYNFLYKFYFVKNT